MILSERVTPLPTVLTANVNRAFSKLDDVKASVLSKNVHVFAATETWFNSVISDEIVGIDNFTLYRDDRSDGRVGGGLVFGFAPAFRQCVWFLRFPSLAVNVFVYCSVASKCAFYAFMCLLHLSFSQRLMSSSLSSRI